MHNYLNPDLAHERKWLIATYILQIVGLFFTLNLPFIIAVIINYIRENKAPNTFIAVHHRWQIRTFWYSLLWIVVGILTSLIVIGPVILLINYIWTIYRVIKGLIHVIDNEPVFPYQRKNQHV